MPRDPEEAQILVACGHEDVLWWYQGVFADKGRQWQAGLLRHQTGSYRTLRMSP